MSKITFIALTCFTVFLSLSASGETWYVDGGVSSSGDGTSWQGAFMTVQEGIDSASHGDTVVVARGTYNENIRFNGKNIVLRSTDPTDFYIVESTIIDPNGSRSVVTFDGTEDGTCVLSGFTIQNGSATIGGGISGAGLGGMATRATIENNIIRSNRGQNWGGGVAYVDGVIQNNLISDNEAWNAAGLYACDGLIQNNVISGNSGIFAGGLALCGGIIQNNVIADNSADEGGGGLGACNGIVRNNTIVRNSSTSVGGGGLAFCAAAIENCIIWGNAAPTGAQIYESRLPTYSCIQDWTKGGEGNISENPQFVDFAEGDYRPSDDSPCIDAGRNDDWMRDAVDLDGIPRILRGDSSHTVDMGAYEYSDETPDTSPPYVWDRDPAPNALQVPVSANVVLHVKDQRSGVDETSIIITVNGMEVTPTIAGTPADFTVSYDPPSDFPHSEIVTVTVDATDLSSPANVMERVTYSFTTTREPSAAKTWYVDGSSSASGDGTSWGTAFKTIQEGIDAAEDDDTVIVAQGTYIENIRFESRNITLRSTNPSDPTVVENTTIDGDQSGPVVTFSGTEDETCVLAGFTIRNGKADWGGGICGGTALGYTHATIEKNIITANSAYSGGGLAWCDGMIRDNTITDNTVEIGAGGGLAWCHGIIQNNSICGNSSVGPGGLFCCDGLIQNNEILENSAGYGGGLAWCEGTIRNNLIAGNSATEDGGGLAYCNWYVGNNTIVHNSAVRSGGGVRLSAGIVMNCIIWGNSASNGPQISYVSPTYSCIQGGGGGIGCIPDDPQFVDPDGPDDNLQTHEDNDYHLLADSPCIDAGQNEDWMRDAVDLDGIPRILRGDSSLTVDMGAYEYYDETMDTSPPYAVRFSPARDAIDVPVDSNIVLHLKDDGKGVDKDSIVMTVNGLEVIPTITGTPLDFTVTYDPPSNFGYGQTVTVTVDASDLCSPAKVMSRVTYSFTTFVPDVTPPVITLLGDNPMTLECGTPHEEPGYTATDDRDGDITGDVVVTGSVDHTVLSTYTLRYNVSDSSGNPAEEKIRTVEVVDTTAPVITLLGDAPMTLECGTPYEEPGYTATDMCEGDLTAQVVVTGGVDHTYPGSYALKYNVVDSSGNAANEKARVINVVDTTPPEITLLGDNPMTLEVGTPYEEPGYTATDPCDGDLTAEVVITGLEKLDHNVEGTYELRYNVSDWEGNAAEEQVRTIIVVETAPFEIVQVREGTEGTCELAWNSRPGEAYTVWSCFDLVVGPWVEEATILADVETTTWTDLSTACICKFYRVQIAE